MTDVSPGLLLQSLLNLSYTLHLNKLTQVMENLTNQAIQAISCCLQDVMYHNVQNHNH